MLSIRLNTQAEKELKEIFEGVYHVHNNIKDTLIGVRLL